MWDNVNLILFAQYKQYKEWFCNSVKRTLKDSFSEAKTEQLEGKTAHNLDLDSNFFGQVLSNFFHFQIHSSLRTMI